jgi:16S rRNA (uracil1498-N3)-methyltransferase
MRRFFIDQPTITVPASVLISGSDVRHIKNVLRLKPGDDVRLFDGKGLEYDARIVNLSSDRVELLATRSFCSKTESPIQIAVAQGFLKDKKMDDLIRQLTELGITKWIPFFAERSVPKPDKRRLDSRTERWKNIAKESLKQCRRGIIPEIISPVSFEDALRMGNPFDFKIIFWENEYTNFAFPQEPCAGQYQTIFAILGPEGGFSLNEVERAVSCGWVASGLGPRILRAETATISAVTLLQYFFGDMGQKKS